MDGRAVLDGGKVEAVEAMTRPILEQAKAIEVTSEETFAAAMEGARRCKVAMDNVEGVFGDSRASAHRTWKAICTAIKSLVDPLEKARGLFDQKAYAWRESERKRLAAEERKRQAEAKRIEEEKLLAIAADLSEAGLEREADAMIAEPVRVEARAVEAPKAEGVTFRENWQWEVTDLAALVRAVAEAKAPADAVTVNGPVVTKLVKALKANANLPGVRVWDAGTAVVR
jgi:hypothetical protein